MRVYIKGMEMPENCCECFAFKSNVSGQLFCKAKRIAFGKDDAEWLPKRTPNWCPLVLVPPHGDLIDRDLVLRKAWDMETFADAVRNAPTVIEAEEADDEH